MTTVLRHIKSVKLYAVYRGMCFEAAYSILRGRAAVNIRRKFTISIHIYGRYLPLSGIYL